MPRGSELVLEARESLGALTNPMTRRRLTLPSRLSPQRLVLSQATRTEAMQHQTCRWCVAQMDISSFWGVQHGRPSQCPVPRTCTSGSVTPANRRHYIRWVQLIMKMFRYCLILLFSQLLRWPVRAIHTALRGRRVSQHQYRVVRLAENPWNIRVVLFMISVPKWCVWRATAHVVVHRARHVRCEPDSLLSVRFGTHDGHRNYVDSVSFFMPSRV